MPISFNYNKKENVIYAKAKGNVTLADVMSYFSSVSELDLQKGYRVLVDSSEVLAELSSQEINEMAKRRKKISLVDEEIRIAIVCKEDVVFGLVRMYEMLLGENGYNLTVFRRKDKAMEWLGI